MVVDDFDIVSVSILEAETYTPLVVNPNGMLTVTVVLERVVDQPVRDQALAAEGEIAVIFLAVEDFGHEVVEMLAHAAMGAAVVEPRRVVVRLHQPLFHLEMRVEGVAQLGELGLAAFWAMILFIGILFAGYFYELKRGGFQWD